MFVILSFDTICHLHCHLRMALSSHLLFVSAAFFGLFSFVLVPIGLPAGHEGLWSTMATYYRDTLVAEFRATLCTI